jgi:hypothetical protein
MKYSRNWTKQKPNLLFLPKLRKDRRWDEGEPQDGHTLGWHGPGPSHATRGWDRLVHLLMPPFRLYIPLDGKNLSTRSIFLETYCKPPPSSTWDLIVILIVILMTYVRYLYSINCPTVICLPIMLLFILWRDTTSELWTPVQFPLHCYYRLLLLALFTCLHTITFYHSIRSILCLQQTGEIDNLIVSWGKVLGCVVCRFHVAAGAKLSPVRGVI